MNEVSELIPQHGGGHTFYVEPIPDDLSNGLAEKWIDWIKNKFSNFFNHLKNIIYIIILIIIGVVIFLIIFYISLRTKCFGIGLLIKTKLCLS